MSKTIAKIIIGAFIVLLLFIGLLYYTLCAKVTNVSDEEPYSGVINKKLCLVKDVFITKSREVDAYANPYLISEIQDDSSARSLSGYILPKGTAIKIYEANIYKNGVSGFAQAYVLGTVYIKELSKEVHFEYNWGQSHVTIYSEQDDYWTFPLAPWQTDTEPGKFYFD